MKYDVDYFIRKFAAIPEDNWYTHEYTNNDGTKMCALGHCGSRQDEDDTSQSNALRDILEHCVGSINDGSDSRYQQPTPKQRILAALNDIKAGKL
jgi:hypothetical protein